MPDEMEHEEEISWDDAFREVAESENDDANDQAGRTSGAEAPTVSFQQLQPGEKKGDSVDLDFLLDIPLEVRVEIGRTKMLIRDLLQLGQSSVIELTKPSIETSFDVLVNDKIVARGEIVVINDRFGIRLTDIVSPMERVEHIA